MNKLKRITAAAGMLLISVMSGSVFAPPAMADSKAGDGCTMASGPNGRILYCCPGKDGKPEVCVWLT